MFYGLFTLREEGRRAGTWGCFLGPLFHSCCHVNPARVPKRPGVGVRHGEGTEGHQRGREKTLRDRPCCLVKGAGGSPQSHTEPPPCRFSGQAPHRPGPRTRLCPPPDQPVTTTIRAPLSSATLPRVTSVISRCRQQWRRGWDGGGGSQGEDPGAGKLGHLPAMTQPHSGAETPQPCSPVPSGLHSPAPACAPHSLSLAPLLLCLTHTHSGTHLHHSWVFLLISLVSMSLSLCLAHFLSLCPPSSHLGSTLSSHPPHHQP